MNRRVPEALYALNLSLLATHQVDAAYWHEWDVFGVPGGLGFFLLFNLGAMLVLVAGLVLLCIRHPMARASTLACAGVGAATCAIHGVFLVRDRAAFWAPISLALLGAILVTTVAQVVTSRKLKGTTALPQVSRSAPEA